MSYGLLGTLLLLLLEGRWVQQRQGQLWVRPGETAELSCHTSHASDSVNWYKEKPDGGLYWIYWSSEFSFTKGKYLGKKKSQWIFSLSISPVQREDSGVYYCSSSDFFPLFGNGTRLIVTSEYPVGHPAAGDIATEVSKKSSKAGFGFFCFFFCSTAQVQNEV
ncbi:unnamed protein product [Bubo scandiacus]